MTDRELLERAAKAAGIVLNTKGNGEVPVEGSHARIWDRSGPVRVLFYSDARDHPMCRKPSQPGNVEWNPLDDDGDALRLAVKLSIDLEFQCPGVEAYRSANHPSYEGGGMFCACEDGADESAATRRAIVRAAAAIASPTLPSGE